MVTENKAVAIALAMLLPAERNNTTGLFFTSMKGIIPTGSRQINVILNMNYVRGRVNDAYADKLSLVITKVPEPSMSGLMLVGIGLIAWRLPKKHQQK